jgi:hypothetical protein
MANMIEYKHSNTIVTNIKKMPCDKGNTREVNI